MTRPALSLLLLAACGGGGDAMVTTRADVVLLTQTDSGEPLAGVKVRVGNEDLGESDGLGVLHTVAEGPSGTLVPIAYECPEGFQAKDEPSPLQLVAFQSVGEPSEEARGLEFRLECSATERWAALVVKAGQPDLPVLVDGEEVGRTDETGIAHHTLRAAPGSTHQITVLTPDPRMRPQNPSPSTIAIRDVSETFVVEKEISIARPTMRRRGRRSRMSTMRRIIRIN